MAKTTAELIKESLAGKDTAARTNVSTASGESLKTKSGSGLQA